MHSTRCRCRPSWRTRHRSPCSHIHTRDPLLHPALVLVGLYLRALPSSAANLLLRPPLALLRLHLCAHDSGLRPLALAQDQDAMEMINTMPDTPALPRSRRSASTSVASPALRSRWSSSTLSSIHSAHAVTASPKTFSFRGATCCSASPRSAHRPTSSKSPVPALNPHTWRPTPTPAHTRTR
ncbi:hypothetical protein DFH08DRAFT_304489 [Mycena albidolilacea]|uniref:Uncharacterized protein n=1 Tax=Mycena albidolilacea TaxID=1033008 RepID=A0AAD6ZP34_9AGAR|nr:hypothetical protein DFH08DRAFT_304489 [Mycena albidolilacea]